MPLDTRTVQSYSPRCATVHPMLSWANPSPRPNGISNGSAVLHSSPQSVPVFYNGLLFLPSKLPPSRGGSESPSRNSWFLEPTRAHYNPNGTSIGSAVLQSSRVTTATNRQTDGQTTRLERCVIIRAAVPGYPIG